MNKINKTFLVRVFLLYVIKLVDLLIKNITKTKILCFHKESCVENWLYTGKKEGETKTSMRTGTSRL